ncbi:MAG: cadherin-like domain-containing protein, partial [Salinimicrobium sediminis]|nr:cadherin-like domain-containing protein [Salinimicrobium sediminis]
LLDGEAGGDETDEFASKENTTMRAPMLIATLASGESNLVFETNTGFTVNTGDVYALDYSILKISGAPVADIIYTVEEVPTNGWLVKGASILEEGANFTQNDIDVMNILYINNGEGSSDNFVLSARDKAGSRVEPFNVAIIIN